MILEKTEAQLHAEMVVSHLNDLEGIKEAVIEKQHYEAAEVITKSISLIKSTHITNEYLTKENDSLKRNLRNHFACTAMNALLSRPAFESLESDVEMIPVRSFAIADRMMEQSKEE